VNKIYIYILSRPLFILALLALLLPPPGDGALPPPPAAQGCLGGEAAAVAAAQEVQDIQEAPAPLPWPVRGAVTSGFGPRVDPFTGAINFHTGIDIAAPEGTTVRAAAGGVAKTGYDPAGWGSFVIIRDKDIEYHYYHLLETYIKTGDFIQPGQVIGLVGNTGASTGPHLHFGIKKVLNPLPLLD